MDDVPLLNQLSVSPGNLFKAGKILNEDAGTLCPDQFFPFDQFHAGFYLSVYFEYH